MKNIIVIGYIFSILFGAIVISKVLLTNFDDIPYIVCEKSNHIFSNGKVMFFIKKECPESFTRCLCDECWFDAHRYILDFQYKYQKGDTLHL